MDLILLLISLNNQLWDFRKYF